VPATDLPALMPSKGPRTTCPAWTGHYRVMPYVQPPGADGIRRRPRRPHGDLLEPETRGSADRRADRAAKRASLPVGYLVDYLEEHGYGNAVGPRNRRATLVCCTGRGWYKADARARMPSHMMNVPKRDRWHQ
jgi:hypothetical protein